ncbi:hypothetical protein ABVK25_011448 [Lepraria finkii]|uniref:Uncharacterized protein n=1 Tax=Lepraria finkii TaxID=1340010 RepID=A0ABR4AP47_9LECA
MLRAGQVLTCFQEEYEVYTVDVPSSENFDGPKSILPHTTAYTTTAHRFMSSLPGFTKSTCIRTSDGIAIIWFIKKGMTSPWGYLGQLLFKATVSALQALIKIYVLPRAIDGDLRHVWNFKEEVTRHDAQNRPYGVYRWAYWFPQVQPRPQVSAETHPPMARRHATLVHYVFRAW